MSDHKQPRDAKGWFRERKPEPEFGPSETPTPGEESSAEPESVMPRNKPPVKPANQLKDLKKLFDILDEPF